MIQALNPYSTTAKTAEIMARYRPIAPKPADAPAATDSNGENSSLPKSICQSPFLRNVWPHLQARPTRTRKRGRTALAPPAVKRARTSSLQLQGFSSSDYSQLHTSPTAKTLSLQGFSQGSPNGLLPPVSYFVALNSVLEAKATGPANLVTLPLLPCSTSSETASDLGAGKGIDLNIPTEEQDFLQQLRRSPTSPNIVISPQPVRLIGSSISVSCIKPEEEEKDNHSVCDPAAQVAKTPEQVEEEVESDAFPTILSDSNNKVRMVNSAYKEMVGQPVCSWLDCMVSCSCKRIAGEVMLHFLDSTVPISSSFSSNGFTCCVSIEWGNNGNKKSVNAFSRAIKLACRSKDYLFAWRFHTNEANSERVKCLTFVL